MKYVIRNSKNGKLYVHTEDGITCYANREPAEFDQETALTIARQLSEKHGGKEFVALPIYEAQPIIEKFKTKVEAAAAFKVSPSTIYRWQKSGHIGKEYLHIAASL